MGGRLAGATVISYMFSLHYIATVRGRKTQEEEVARGSVPLSPKTIYECQDGSAAKIVKPTFSFF